MTKHAASIAEPRRRWEFQAVGAREPYPGHVGANAVAVAEALVGRREGDLPIQRVVPRAIVATLCELTTTAGLVRRPRRGRQAYRQEGRCSTLTLEVP
jgi:hypothetical protein